MRIQTKDSFKTTRMKKGFSLTKLAKTIHVSKQAMGQFESKKIGLAPETAKTITVVLGVEFDDIFEIVER